MSLATPLATPHPAESATATRSRVGLRRARRPASHRRPRWPPASPTATTVACKAVNHQACRRPGSGLGSDIQLANVERVGLDEVAPWLDLVAHQHGENLLCFHRIVDTNLEQHPAIRVHSGLPELVRIHFA